MIAIFLLAIATICLFIAGLYINFLVRERVLFLEELQEHHLSLLELSGHVAYLKQLDIFNLDPEILEIIKHSEEVEKEFLEIFELKDEAARDDKKNEK